MTGDPLALERLHVRRAPGFDTEEIPVDGLSPGVNVIHGPNASGKTTLAKSIHWLLWPEAAADGASVRGHLARNGVEWRVSVDPSGASYQRDGQADGGPPLPPADHRDRYVLSLHDLLQQTTQDAAFAREIRREAVGGYDLDAAREALGFDDAPTHPTAGVVTAADEAVEAVRHVESDMEALEDERRQLTALDRKLEDARAARREVTLLEQAIEHARARDDHEAATRERDAFPDELAHVDGDEIERVREIDDDIAACRREIEAAEADRAEAAATRAETDLPAEGVPGGLVVELDERVDRLDELEREYGDLAGDLEAASGKRSAALDDLPVDVDEAALVELEPADREAVQAFVRTAYELTANRTMADAVEDWLGASDGLDADAGTLERGRDHLERWLASPASGSAADSRTALLPLAAACLLAGVLGAVLGVAVDPVFWAVLPLAGGLLYYGYRRLDAADVAGRGREAARRQFEETGLASPDAWEPAAVTHRLEELHDRLAAHALDAERQQRYESLEPNRDDLADLASRVDELRTTLRERLGADPDVGDLDLVAFTNALRRWQTHHDEVVGLERERAALEEQLSDVRTAIADDLAPYGDEPVDDEPVEDAATARSAVRDLQARAERFDEATRAIERTDERIERAESRIDDLTDERTAIFESVGLDPGAEDRLADRCGRAAAYEDACVRVRETEALLDNEAGKLESLPGYEPELKEQPLAELEERKRAAADRAAEYDDIRDDIQSIETKIREAKRDDELEDAVAECDRALDDLEAQLASDYADAVGDVLVSHLRGAARERTRPAVFERSRELFAAITNGRYRLDVADDADAFRAYDTVKARGFGLDELSSGTRIQLLLSVRVAFVERQEDGVGVPLVLDETLANADDERAAAVVEATIELARDGRQVFYFTARGAAVSTWRSALGAVDDVPHEVIDLAAVRGLADGVDVPADDRDSLAVTTPSPPDPDGHDHASYGEALDVPAFDPAAGAGRAHLWYLVEDVSLLCDLLDRGIERWGQLSELLARSGADGLTDDPASLDAVAHDGRALEAFVDLWQVGRGEPVTRDVLEATAAVTATFIDDVADLAADLDGDGEALVAALEDGEVDRFRTSKAADLETYLADRGYIDEADPLDPAVIRARVATDLVEAHGVAADEARDRTRRLVDRLSGPDTGT